VQIFLIGPSGSGKDTQAQLICKKYDLHWVSIGSLLRKRMLLKDELGLHIQKNIEEGNLVEWAILKTLVSEELNLHPKNYIWTGFPRKVEQAVECDKMLQNSAHKLDLVINLNVDKETSKSRIKHRIENDKNVRIDDVMMESVNKRLSWFYSSIDGIRSYYIRTNRFVDIDGSKSIEDVFKDIITVINK
jgi:adenylate kinase